MARRAAAGGAERADGPAEAGLAAPHRLHALVRSDAGGAAAGARSRDRRPRRRHDRRGREADRDRRPRRHPARAPPRRSRRWPSSPARCSATSLLGKGLFDGNPYALDIAGAFASDFARERFAEADLVIGVGRGARPLHDRGRLSLSRRAHRPDRHQPARPVAGPAHRRPACARRRQGRRRGDRRAHEAARRRADRLPQQRDGQADRGRFARQQGIPGAAQHRRSAQGGGRARPGDAEGLGGRGRRRPLFQHGHDPHEGPRRPSAITWSTISAPSARRLPAAIGIAAAQRRRQGLLVEGDGSLMMHVQELETIRRHGIRMLIAIMNDGGYGAEFHKFRANGVDRQGSDPRPRRSRRRRHRLRPARRLGHRAGPLRAAVPRAPGRQHRHAVGRPHRRPDPVARLSPRPLRRGVRRRPAPTVGPRAR